jgi:hypothetical protein
MKGTTHQWVHLCSHRLTDYTYICLDGKLHLLPNFLLQTPTLKILSPSTHPSIHMATYLFANWMIPNFLVEQGVNLWLQYNSQITLFPGLYCWTLVCVHLVSMWNCELFWWSCMWLSMTTNNSICVLSLQQLQLGAKYCSSIGKIKCSY